MIVVIEGPSASGKTTSVARLAAPESIVHETEAIEPPRSASVEDVAAFWSDESVRRWSLALSTEERTGIAVCDSDPLKLHYHYSLVQIGLLSSGQLQADLHAVREALSRRRLGIADLIFCNIPDTEVLDERMRGDGSRSRRRYDVHRRLGEPLRTWYHALSELDPARVQWAAPESLASVDRRDRYDTNLFDAWMARLGIA